MTDYQERVVKEKQELDNKLSKLSDFITNNPIFNSLPNEDRFLLISQHKVMDQYSSILFDRIKRF